MSCPGGLLKVKPSNSWTCNCCLRHVGGAPVLGATFLCASPKCWATRSFRNLFCAGLIIPFSDFPEVLTVDDTTRLCSCDAAALYSTVIRFFFFIWFVDQSGEFTFFFRSSTLCVSRLVSDLTWWVLWCESDAADVTQDGQAKPRGGG